MRDLARFDRALALRGQRTTAPIVRTYIAGEYRMRLLLDKLRADLRGDCAGYQSAIVLGDEHRQVFAVWLYAGKDPSIWATPARKVRLDSPARARL